MKIIKEGNVKNTYIKVCQNCGCEFEYEAHEVNSDGTISCPQCNYNLLHVTAVPKLSNFNTSVSNDKTYNPCDTCSNNPKNNPNASGVCHCVLGGPKITC